MSEPVDQLFFPQLTGHGHDRDMPTHLEVAHAIGRKMCKEAIWWNDRCTWQGLSHQLVNLKSELVMRTLSPALYDGLAGVALFLAELSVRVKDEVVEATLAGAINNLIDQLEVPQLNSVFGLYKGQLGLGYALWRMGSLRANRGWVDKGLSALYALTEKQIPAHELDVVSGVAGAIPVWLKLHKAEQAPEFLEQAVLAGDLLLAKAHKGPQLCSWECIPDEPAGADYAQGAAGISLALLALYEVTGQQAYKEVAEKGFAFVQEGWSVHADENWLNGAPGIALAWLRACELTGDKQYEQQAIAALEATCHAIGMQVKNIYGTNFSLAKGLAGNAAVLLEGSRVLHRSAPIQSGAERCARVAQEVAELGTMLYHATGTDWPGGVPVPPEEGYHHVHPSLMLGMAGTGLFYLGFEENPPDSVLLMR